MAFNLNLPLLNVALAGIAGGLGNKDQKRVQTGTNTPIVSPEEAQLRAKLIQQYGDVSADPNLTGYEASGTQDINDLAKLHAQNLQETLALHGITGPAAGAAEAGVDAGRFSDISRFRQTLPLVRNQIQSQNIGTGLGILNSFPRGSTQTETGTIKGSPFGGALGNAASTLAYFLGRGAFQQPKASGNKPMSQGVPLQYPKIATPPYVGVG